MTTPSPPDWRGLCEELFTAFNTYAVDEVHHFLLWRARAALAQPEPEAVGPSDEEIIAFWSEHCAGEGDAGIIRLARFGGRPAPAPAGEVGELVAWLREEAHYQGSWPDQRPSAAVQLTRAADLLEQRHPAPVPVSERLPGPEDCDAEGRCWWGSPCGYITGATWFLRTVAMRKTWDTHWLPANALPLPQGEVVG